MSAAPAGVRVRFAPSPTGHLHVGNARTALFNWLFARSRAAGGAAPAGSFILRIEDTDAERSSPESERAILEDLRWLGLDWDEGPDRGGPCGPYRQSERADLYRRSAQRLLEAGHAYRCFCSPGQLEQEREAQRAAGMAPRYSGRCRALAPDESDRRASSSRFALRFRVESVAQAGVVLEDLVRGRVEVGRDQIGDPVIVRADGGPTYNFAVVVDDIAMRITHVIRGEDHLSNTARQILIYRALGAEPPRFAHLSLVMGPDGSPLSKRHGASSVADFRQRGFLPEALVNYLALLGWAHPEGREILPAPEIVRHFDLSRVGRAPATFDIAKLTWLNAWYVRSADPGRLALVCRPELARAGYLPDGPCGEEVELWIARALQVHSGQLETLAAAADVLHPLFRFEEHLGVSPAAAAALAGLAAEPGSADVIATFADLVERADPPLLLSRESFREAALAAGRRAGVKGRGLFHPIRVAVSGSDSGPELDRLVPLIDEGSGLPLPAPVLSCARRARLVASRLARLS